MRTQPHSPTITQSYPSALPKAEQHQSSNQCRRVIVVAAMKVSTVLLLDLALSTFVLWLPFLLTLAATTTATTSNDYPRQYQLLLPEEISRRLLSWKTDYPDLCVVTTAQDAYGLPRSGNNHDCLFDEGGAGCLHYIVTLQDLIAHPLDSHSSRQLPEVFLSGALHGNERVGPTAVVEAAALILEAAACEALPSVPPTDSDYPQQYQRAKSCRSRLASQGISTQQRQWLARLLATRRIVLVPTANALGYQRNERTEENMDPNRDFPFDVQDAKECFKTIAGRTLNEIFREHMFQLSLTFHGGTEVIGYEWGAPTYLHQDSPDDIAQHDIAQAYSNYGAGWKNSNPYDYGNMNDKVYYVRGGFEDWAYAGSWDPDRVIQCQPETYSPYPKEKAIYNNSTLRVFNMLVETSNNKIPPMSELGTSELVLDHDTPGNGHVSRNIRLALIVADLVQPYVRIVGVHNLALSEDIIPLFIRRCDNRYTNTNTNIDINSNIPVIMIPKNLKEFTMEWSVGGALTVDDTSLWFAKDSAETRALYDCINQPQTHKIQHMFTKATPNGATNGTAFFSTKGPQPHPTVSKTDVEPALGPVFTATIDVSNLKPSDRIVAMATARVDQGWTMMTHNVGPKGLQQPQAHVVNARTNPNWNHESSGKVIQGRLDWWSIPVIIVVGNYDDSVGNQQGREISIVETSNRFGETQGHFAAGGVSPTKELDDGISWKVFMGGATGLVLFSMICALLLEKRRNHRPQLQHADGDVRNAYRDEDDDDDDEDDDTVMRGLELRLYRDDDPLGGGNNNAADRSQFSII